MVGAVLGTSKPLPRRGRPCYKPCSRVSLFRQRAVALFHRTDQLKADSAERRERWNQVIAEVIAEHQKDQEKSKH